MSKGRIDRFGRLVVMVLEQIRVRAERERRGGVSQAPAHGDNAQAGGNQGAGVGVSHPMECYLRQLPRLHRVAPVIPNAVRIRPVAVDFAKNRRKGGKAPIPN